MNLDRLLKLDSEAIRQEQLPPQKRFLFQQLRETTGRPFVALLGPRGSGKTVLLRQLRSQIRDAIYLSADTLESDDRLEDVVRALAERYGIHSFFIDEIHFIPEYHRGLKELYDFTEVTLWFTSSVALSLHTSGWDLSRRVQAIQLLPFSFREYLAFVHGEEFAPLPVDELLRAEVSPEHLRTSPRFDAYLRGGLYPFMLERGAGTDQFGAILQTVVRRDIPACAPSVTHDDLAKIDKLLHFIGKSPIDGINYTSVSRNVGITTYKAERFIEFLERSFILRRAFPSGTNVLREPKVFMELPYRVLFRPFEECVGELREDFFALAMAQHGMPFSYAKTTRGSKTPDFILELSTGTVVLEVGGRGKGRSQFKGLRYDAKVVLSHGDDLRAAAGLRVPLHCLGFAPQNPSSST